MRNNTFRFAVALVAAGFAFASGPVAAQKIYEVVVETSGVEHTGERASATGAPIDTVSIRHRVSYKDIDMSTASGSKALEQRIQDTAKRACAELKKLYMTDVTTEKESSCVKTATDHAMAQAHAASEAAENARH